MNFEHISGLAKISLNDSYQSFDMKNQASEIETCTYQHNQATWILNIELVHKAFVNKGQIQSFSANKFNYRYISKSQILLWDNSYTQKEVKIVNCSPYISGWTQ